MSVTSQTRRRAALGVLVALIVAVALGPKPRVSVPNRADIERRLPAVLESLPAYLTREEASVPGIHANTEKRIVWARDTDSVPHPHRTARAVVYLHGFSATRQETAPLSEMLAQALNANLFETRLTGHGLPGEAMGRASAGDWIADAMEAFAIGQRLGDSVIVVATSTGGTLALWLAAQPEDQRRGLQALVLISPNIAINDPSSRFLTWPWMQSVLPLMMPERSWSSRNKEQERYWTTRYPTRALFPLAALVADVRAEDATRIVAPTLVFTNQRDNVVDAVATTKFLDRMTNTRVQRVNVVPVDGEDAHVLVGRIVSPSQVTPFLARTLSFLSAR